MTDKPKETQDVTLSIDLPDVFTVAMYETFHQAQQQYVASVPEGQVASTLLMRYHGSLALIRAGFVHVRGPERLVKLVKQEPSDTTPLAVVGIIAREIAGAVDREVSRPLDSLPE